MPPTIDEPRRAGSVRTGLVVLTILDLVVMRLIWREYRLREFEARP